MSQVPPTQAIQTALQFHKLGKLPQAEIVYREVLARDPKNHNALHLLGVLLHQKGQNTEALDLIQKSLALKENFSEAHANLGIVLQALGQIDPAIAAFQRAVHLNPKNAAGFYNLGVAYKDKSLYFESFQATKQALDLNPRYFAAHNNMAILLRLSGRPEESLDACRAALDLNPKSPEAHLNLGMALDDLASFDDSIAAFRQAIALNPNFAKAHDAILFRSYYDLNATPQSVIAQHRAWADKVAKPFLNSHYPQSHDRSPDRPLKIGYVSPDFRLHAVSFFFLPVLEAHNRSQFHVTCYSNQSTEDDITRRIQSSADQYRSIANLSDDAAADLIRHDQIDILIDLAGHSADGRLTLFARKPAPLQITWLGYPGTTGLSTIDYRLTDPIADPDLPSEPIAPEKLLRLPSTWCFSSLGLEPPIAPSPFSQNGYITFGTFNRLAKVSPVTLDLWAQILTKLPTAHLLLKNGANQSAATRQNILDFFLKKGIPESRLHLNPYRGSIYEHREAYNQIDIALDTFPYHGTTTTCEALFMAVPVITLTGNAHVSRVGPSLLTTAGGDLKTLIASTPQQYIDIAVSLATNPARLARLRQSLRPQLQSSPLMNAPHFAAHLESALRQAWRTHCQSHPTPPNN